MQIYYLKLSIQIQRSPLFQIQLMVLGSFRVLAIGTIQAFPSVIIEDLAEHSLNIYGSYKTFTETQKDELGKSILIRKINN